MSVGYEAVEILIIAGLIGWLLGDYFNKITKDRVKVIRSFIKGGFLITDEKTVLYMPSMLGDHDSRPKQDWEKSERGRELL
jgi:hypothetical protein